MSSEQAQLNFQVQALEQMAILLAPGRVVVKVTTLEALEGTVDDLLMEAGDEITVPQQPNVVTILGAVRNATTVLYRKEFGVEAYINEAGGLTPQALEDETYIVGADGSTERGYLKVKEVKPGDAIVVPTNIEPKSRPIQLWQAVASILGSVMLGVAAIAVIGR